MIRHLYLHIPFCHRICPYCAFYKHLPGSHDQAAFVEAVLRELKTARDRWPLALETIYMGGGTPSMLGRGHLQTLLQGVSELAGDGVGEWTLEANPRTFDEEKAILMRQGGVTRVSLGVQSWDPQVLTTLGRDHSPAEAEEAFFHLRAAEFSVVNIDLMFSVPGLSLECWEKTIQKTLSLQPDHISAYNLTYEEDTAFMEGFRKGNLDKDEDRDAGQFYRSLDLLEAAGFEHYETSNYARGGHFSRHNQAYWKGSDFLGLGPGAVSTVEGRRWTNVADTALYTEMIGKWGRAEGEEEILTPNHRLVERISMLLRTREGIELAWLEGMEGASDRAGYLEKEGWWESAGEGKVRLVRHKRGMVDSVVEYLLV